MRLLLLCDLPSPGTVFHAFSTFSASVPPGARVLFILRLHGAAVDGAISCTHSSLGGFVRAPTFWSLTNNAADRQSSEEVFLNAFICS